MLVSTNYICWKRESEKWFLWGPWKWFMSQSILSRNLKPAANCYSLLEMTTTKTTTSILNMSRHCSLSQAWPQTQVCVMEKVFNIDQESVQLFLIDSTAGRYIYQEPPEQKIITCCEANRNVTGASCPRAEESAQKHGFTGTAKSWLRSKALLIADVLFNACSRCWHSIAEQPPTFIPDKMCLLISVAATIAFALK